MKRIASLAGILLLPGIALAAPRNLKELTDLALTYINAGIGIALMAGIVVYFLGVTNGLRKSMGGSKDSGMNQQILWGLIALFVMFSVWGILALLRNTLFGGGSYDPYAGSSSGGGGCFSIDCSIGGGGSN